MKLIKEIVAQVLAEAKKKKSKKKDEAEPAYVANPREYGYAQALDFAPPLGDSNLYKRQGGSAWGPMTSAGTAYPDTNVNSLDSEKALRATIKDEIKEQITSSWSAWDILDEAFAPQKQIKKESAWAAVNAFLDSK